MRRLTKASTLLNSQEVKTESTFDAVKGNLTTVQYQYGDNQSQLRQSLWQQPLGKSLPHEVKAGKGAAIEYKRTALLSEAEPPNTRLSFAAIPKPE